MESVVISHSFWSGKRVLLTGHTGFKGTWLLLWLQKLGAEVWGYSLAPDSEASLFDSFVQRFPAGRCWHHCEADLRNLDRLRSYVSEAQPDVVIHLAAQALVRRSYIDPLGTWATNVQGSLNLLESLRHLERPCAVVMVTTDKVYENNEWTFGYREIDPLGGSDPYSASKAAAELAISSWRKSFCGKQVWQTPYLFIASARAGNVIGGGDWAKDRIIPDAVKALSAGEVIGLRNPSSTRPWQHVLEPLSGYLQLAQALASTSSPPCEAFNFGPSLESNKSVHELITTLLNHWPGKWVDCSNTDSPHEATLLHLQTDKAYSQLGWRPCWDYLTTVERTIRWYKLVHEGSDPIDCCISDLDCYQNTMSHDRTI